MPEQIHADAINAHANARVAICLAALGWIVALAWIPAAMLAASANRLKPGVGNGAMKLMLAGIALELTIVSAYFWGGQGLIVGGITAAVLSTFIVTKLPVRRA